MATKDENLSVLGQSGTGQVSEGKLVLRMAKSSLNTATSGATNHFSSALSVLRISLPIIESLGGFQIRR